MRENPSIFVADPDPGSGAFLTLNPGSQTHILDILMTNFWVKSTIIRIIYNFMIFVATKNGRTKKFPPPQIQINA